MIDITKLTNILLDYFNSLSIDNIKLINSILNPLPKTKRTTHKISLRFIEWFISIYSFNNKLIINKKTLENYIPQINKITIYFIDDDLISINNNYKIQTHVYTKEYFDLFNRQHHLTYKFNDGTEIETSLAQLNYLKWLIENNIISYMLKNYDYLLSQFTQYNRMETINKQTRRVKKINKNTSSCTSSPITNNTIESFTLTI